MATAAQPTVIESVSREPSIESHIVYADHAILRALSNTPIDTHGGSARLHRRITHRCGDSIPCKETLLVALFPSDKDRNFTDFLAEYDLYIWAFASSIDIDSVSAAALISKDHFTYLKCSHFLLVWLWH